MMTYQLFSFPSRTSAATGVWRPLRHSGKLEKGLSCLYMQDSTNRVVCCDAVHWLTGPLDARGFRVTCPVAIKTCAPAGHGPRSCQRSVTSITASPVLCWRRRATDCCLQYCRCRPARASGVCGRQSQPSESAATLPEGGQPAARGAVRIPPSSVLAMFRDIAVFPYEMDWSTYISRMKHF
ncbi:unnamed protein product [Urochloa humidicola]